MAFCISFTFHPVRINSVANQSRRSGCDGTSPWEPKSSKVLTIPVPKYICQNRFTATLAVNGFEEPTNHRARQRRLFGKSLGTGDKIAGTPGVTLSPLRS